VHGDHIMIAPPYVVTEEQIEFVVETLSRAIQRASAAT
jgi:adenosylmethionine-8-amino-7-oxononanoate aminotransferase